jgi:tRNA (guanosine-2'-O-)-methyltransferase
VNIQKYSKPKANQSCIQQLRQKGYKIVATALKENATALHEISLEQPIALMFGTEEDGLRKETMDLVDEFMIIPMYGFTQSFNISVSAALSLHYLTNKMREQNIPWQLEEKDQLEIQLQWARKAVRNADISERRGIASGEIGNFHEV